MSTVRDTKGVTIYNEGTYPNATITIRCTCDEYGETISLADANRNIELTVGLEEILKTYKEEKKKCK